MKRLDYYWYHPGIITWLLLPLSWLFCLVAGIRRTLFRFSIIKQSRVSAPVIIVGNISIGGTGKTPLVVLLVNHLKKEGFRPGIISRGYGGNAFKNRSTQLPVAVNKDSNPKQAGDEPVLMAQRCECPVRISPDRVAAAKNLLEETDCNVIVSDDGLQHYAIDRDIEIAVIDHQRRLGNGHCLPAGPLRERRKRLKEVDYIVCNGGAEEGETEMQLTMSVAENIENPTLHKSLSDFEGQTVHALAGIGNPDRFFTQLNRHNIKTINHPYSDHHIFTREDILFDDNAPVLMTEKDAVKCKPFATSSHWSVPVSAFCDSSFLASITERLKKRNG